MKYILNLIFIIERSRMFVNKGGGLFWRSPYKNKKGHPFGCPSVWLELGHLVELQGHGALAVSSGILVHDTLSHSLIDLLDSNLVCAIGLGAIAFCGSDLKLLDGGLQCGLLGLIASIVHCGELNTLLGRLNIRQTKHLLRQIIASVFLPCRMVF